MVDFYRVIAATELPKGRLRAVDLGERQIVLCHAKDGWYALDDVCTHAHARMHEGRLRGHRLLCPLHGASFDCRTGAVLGSPAITALKTYPVRRVGDDIEIGV